MRAIVLSSAVVFALAVAGAGFGSGGTYTGTPMLAGTYVRTVTKADIARTSNFRQEGPGQTLPPTGRVRVTFTSKVLRFVDRTGFAIAQTYSATALGRLTIKAYVDPSKGAFCGPEIPQNALYSWTVTGRTLTLKARSDRCADRDSLLAGRWTRIGS